MKSWLSPLIAAGVALGLSAARAEYPEKVVRFINGFSPGGGVDIQARIVADVMQKLWGQSIIIESRAGGNGSIAADMVSKLPPDGYNVVWVSNAHTSTPSLLNLNYDPIKSFTPITQATRSPDILVVKPDFPARTLKELIELAKSKPGELSFASVGFGGASFLETEMLMKQTGIKLNHVPYTGGGDATLSVLAGHTQIYFGIMGTVLEHIKSGKLRALAIASSERSPKLPDVPTVAEAAGLAKFDAEDCQWTGVLAPAGLPGPVLDKLYSNLAQTLKSDAVRKRMDEAGFVPVASTPDEFTAMMAREIPKWATLLKDVSNKR
jgi:tripartite-type tricarboxylate transporter receptor subunit TctC